MNWQSKQLRDLADLCLGKMLDKEKNQGVLRPYLANVNVRWGTFDLSDLREMRFQDGEVERYGVRAGDIVMCEGGEPGRCAIWRDQRPGMMLQKALHRIRSKPEVDHRFLFYSLVHKGRTRALDQYFTGSTIKHLPGEKLALVEVAYPPLNEQRRIASILSAYDDLIDNNTRRIAILEEMARRIYEEWFVRFRFPSHEGVRMVESELGLVPEGWRTAVLGDVAAYINRGLAPRYAEDAACIVINQKCIRDQRLSLGEARKQDKPVPADKVVRLGDVLINSTGVGTLGRVAQVLEAVENCTVDTHVSIVRPGKDCDSDYFGLTLLAQQAHFEAQGVGSTGQTELSRGRIAETLIVVPPLAVQRWFANIVRPMRRLTVTLQKKNRNLRTTRDLLLPRLISGNLDVSAMPELEAGSA